MMGRCFFGLLGCGMVVVLGATKPPPSLGAERLFFSAAERLARTPRVEPPAPASSAAVPRRRRSPPPQQWRLDAIVYRQGQPPLLWLNGRAYPVDGQRFALEALADGRQRVRIREQGQEEDIYLLPGQDSVVTPSPIRLRRH